MRTPRPVETLKSLFYEARARPEHPVYGSAGYVYSLQRQIFVVNELLFNAKKELASYIGEEHVGLPSCIPPIRLQKQLNPSSSFPSPPILKSAPHAAVKWDLSKIDRKENDFFTAAATLHHQGIPAVIPLRNKGPTPDLRQQKQQDFVGEADLTLDHELDKMDHSSSQIDQSPADHFLLVLSR
ncbi:PREDICTED: LOB domain-containing protein 36-like [Populus euphratica]|uniref:LOB domain-containing protein 36-like n=1 Tax=Populus euphratica TaxID=75702 RepID=A0AAJ6UZY2_POPEU|nr:PREDICTED: LOB domain-containing protein 36-like [Populus euphratica]